MIKHITSLTNTTNITTLLHIYIGITTLKRSVIISNKLELPNYFKVLPLACKCVFYRPKHDAKGVCKCVLYRPEHNINERSHEFNFDGLKM